VTIYGITSTVSTSGDQGADPNEIVDITDQLAAMTLPASEMFSVLGGPQYGVVYRGISFDPVPEPGTIVLLGSALAGLAAVRRRKRALCALPQIEVVVDQLVGARVQRQIPGFLALAGDLDMGNAAARLPPSLSVCTAPRAAARERAASTGWRGRASP
jgi:hypothetical protein